MITDDEIKEVDELSSKRIPKLIPHGGAIRLSGEDYNIDGDEEILCLIGKGPDNFVAPNGSTRALICRHAKYIAAAANSFPSLIARLRAAEDALKFYSETTNYAASLDELAAGTCQSPVDMDFGNNARQYFQATKASK